MRTFNRNNRGFFSGMHIFFKLWFAFIFIVVITVFGLVGYKIYTVAADPTAAANQLGRIAGEVQKGYEDARQPKPEIVVVPEE